MVEANFVSSGITFLIEIGANDFAFFFPFQHLRACSGYFLGRACPFLTCGGFCILLLVIFIHMDLFYLPLVLALLSAFSYLFLHQ